MIFEQEKGKGQPSKESLQLTEFLSTYKPLLTASFFKENGSYSFATNKDLYLMLRKWQVAVRRELSRAAAPKQLEVLDAPFVLLEVDLHAVFKQSSSRVQGVPDGGSRSVSGYE